MDYPERDLSSIGDTLGRGFLYDIRVIVRVEGFGVILTYKIQFINYWESSIKE